MRTPVNISMFILHPLDWSELEKFDPDRFSPEAKTPIQQSKFFPFSLGPRTCIGKSLAEFEARVLMARLLQEFELTDPKV